MQTSKDADLVSSWLFNFSLAEGTWEKRQSQVGTALWCLQSRSCLLLFLGNPEGGVGLFAGMFLPLSHAVSLIGRPVQLCPFSSVPGAGAALRGPGSLLSWLPSPAQLPGPGAFWCLCLTLSCFASAPTAGSLLTSSRGLARDRGAHDFWSVCCLSKRLETNSFIY